MAFNWANVLVAPTGSSGLDTGSHTAVDEDPPWSDSDEAIETITSSATEVAIFSGFDLSNAGGENEGYHIWARMRTTGTFDVTIVVKQAGAEVWTSAPFTVTNTAFATYVIPIPDGEISSNNDLSLEFSCQNTAGNATIRWSWLRMSKSPFTNAQKAVLPSTLVGQNFVCYRASDLGVLGAANNEAVLLWPDASGKGRHAVVRATGATYKTDAPVGVLASTSSMVGCLGYDPSTEAVIRWTGNKILHSAVYPTALGTVNAIMSSADNADLIGVVIPGEKNVLSFEANNEWTIMFGDGSVDAHLHGGAAAQNVLQRVTAWNQMGGGNDKLWEEADASPVINASSGDNPLYSWGIMDRESDDRPLVGRLVELWIIEGTGVTEGELDTARGDWVNGGGGQSLTATAGALRVGTLT